MLISRLLNIESYQVKISCTERLSEYPLKYLSFAKSDAYFLIESKFPFWYKNTFLQFFLRGWGIESFDVPEITSWLLCLSGECIS